MKSLGTGKFSESEKFYWKSMKNWYETNSHLIKKSKTVIHVDFKNKKIIKGACRDLKATINRKVA